MEGKRKLKCSGESTGCTRCVKQNLTCHYSIQKQMGRPRKKQKVTDVSGEGQLPNIDWAEVAMSLENGPSGTDLPVWGELGTLDQHPYPEAVSNPISSYAPLPTGRLSTQPPLSGQLGSSSNRTKDVDSDITPQSNSPKTPSFSTIVESFPSTFDWSGYIDTPMTVTSPPGGKDSQSYHLPPSTSPPHPPNHYSPVEAQPPPVTNPSFPPAPSCSCLPNLYLTLSTLSTLPSAPINTDTIEHLQSATRTAHAVLYCPICPHTFQSGMQNVMLLSTLLTVIADGWSRILRAPPQDLARGFDIDPTTTISSSSVANDSDPANAWTEAQESQWKLFAHYLTRQYVFGDAPPPGIHIPGICPFLPSSTSLSPFKPPILILSNLCDAMERRQKTWHGLVEETGEFTGPRHSSAEALARTGGGDCAVGQKWMGIGLRPNEGQEPLCLKIVASVRNVLAAVARRPDSVEEGSAEQVSLQEIFAR